MFVASAVRYDRSESDPFTVTSVHAERLPPGSDTDGPLSPAMSVIHDAGLTFDTHWGGGVQGSGPGFVAISSFVGESVVHTE